MSYYTKITKAGLAAITAAMNNNSKVPITYMAFGDGNGYIPEPDENATSLVNEVYRVGVNKVEVHSKNPNWLVCESIIPSAVGGFNIREVALYDSTGNTMLAIASYPPTYKPTIEEGAAKIQTIRIVIQVDNSGNFELIVDPDVVLATREEVNKLKESTILTVNSVNAMLSISAKNGDRVQTVSYHEGNNKGGSLYIYNASKSETNNGITNINGWILQFDGRNLDLFECGCWGDGDSENPHDDGATLLNAIQVLASLGGGSLQGNGFSYLNNTVNIEWDYNNVFLVNAKLHRTNTKNGWMIQSAKNKNVTGGGFIKVSGKGMTNILNGNGFIQFGTNNFKHNNWIAFDLEADSFTQYGIGIEAGDNWQAENIRVLNHGPASGVLTACMGFYVFPKIGSKSGRLKKVYSEISIEAQSNPQLNSAAIKLQTHQNADFSEITAIGGSEQCLGIDSIDGVINDLKAYPQGERPGILLGNYNPAHQFSGQKFTLDRFKVIRNSGQGTYDLGIGAGDDGFYKLDGCTIKNGAASMFRVFNRSAFKDCHFENIICNDIRLSTTYLNLLQNTVRSTGNTFINVKSKNTVFALETDNSLIENCGNTPSTSTGGFIIHGDGNNIKTPNCISRNSNGLSITGNNNTFLSPFIEFSNYSIWFKSGSDNNKIISPIVQNLRILNDGGTENKVLKSEMIEISHLTGTDEISMKINEIIEKLELEGYAKKYVTPISEV